MQPEIQAVVFDMDGLMFNTEDLYDQVGQSILERRNQTFTRELKLKMMGLPGNRAFQVMIDECGLDDSVEQLEIESDELFIDLLPREIAKMPGLDDLLDRLEQIGMPKAVATSSHPRFANKALGIFDLEPRFEFVLTSNDVKNGKPSPDIYLLAADKLNVSTRQMLVLEDSHTGSRAAAAAGAFTVAVPTIHSRQIDFGHADLVIESLRDQSLYSLLRN